MIFLLGAFFFLPTCRICWTNIERTCLNDACRQICQICGHGFAHFIFIHFWHNGRQLGSKRRLWEAFVCVSKCPKCFSFTFCYFCCCYFLNGGMGANMYGTQSCGAILFLKHSCNMLVFSGFDLRQSIPAEEFASQSAIWNHLKIHLIAFF